MTQLDSHSQQLALSILERSCDLTLATVRHDGTPHASTVNFASDQLVLYVAIALDSHKAHDVREHGQVALTINAPYQNWRDIQGLSIDGRASWVRDPAELALASSLLLGKVPAYAELIREPAILPWPGMLFMRIAPLTIRLLDYTRGIGHTEQFEVAEA